MSDLDKESAQDLQVIENAKSNFEDDEQKIIDAWIGKLSQTFDTDAGKIIRNEYVKTLARLVTQEKQLLHPFSQNPPNGDLIPLADIGANQPTSTPPASSSPKTPGTPRTSGTPKTPRTSKTPASPTAPATPTAPASPTSPVSPKTLSPMSPGTPAPGTMISRGTYVIKKMPCSKPVKKGRKKLDDTIDKFIEITGAPEGIIEGYEEMASVIANSRGQSFSEFVAAISRFTLDLGREMRLSMKIEINSFKDYVDNVLSQRFKDLSEVLDKEQNAEIQRIKKDTERWLMELAHCRKRIKELVPDFDLTLYRKDKNYVKKIFTLNTPSGAPEDDSFKKWKEETCHRLKWYSEVLTNLCQCNEDMTQEITTIKSQTLDLEAREAIKQQQRIKCINYQYAENKRLNAERDRLQKENAELLAKLQGR